MNRFDTSGCCHIAVRGRKRDLHRHGFPRFRWFFLVFAVLLSQLATAGGGTGYWIALRSNDIVDAQVAERMARRAGLVVLRSSKRARATHGKDYVGAVSELQSAMPDVPVLAYAITTRFESGGRMEKDLLAGLDLGRPAAVASNSQVGKIKFLDLTSPDLRERLAAHFKRQLAVLGVDGYAFDLSRRTPRERPRALAKVCSERHDYCDRYADGIDDLFAAFQQQMGDRHTLAYNGLWNFAPGELQDQAVLLAHADYVAVEYFGLQPKKKTHDFTHDILPYLNVMKELGPTKHVMVFGRGPWAYTDYKQDYLWQRYLFAAYLLAYRPGDLFKYHATFQVPTMKGRADGLAVYIDRAELLGRPLAAYEVVDGVYSRPFSKGLVALVPDDAEYAGELILSGEYYDGDGRAMSGKVRLAPGEALVLYQSKPTRPKKVVRDAETIASWGWQDARLLKDGAVSEIIIEGPDDPRLAGVHDLWLDWVRSGNPYALLTIDADFTSPTSSIFAVAEIDDPGEQTTYAILAIDLASSYQPGFDVPIDFRAPPARKDSRWWPIWPWSPDVGAGSAFQIDGERVFANTGYRFRRWSHLRFDGDIALRSVTLEKPTSLD